MASSAIQNTRSDNYRRYETTPAVVTTSWDDGHPLDLRVAELLASYALRGTFYVPVQYAGFPIMTKEQIRTLRRMGMEIGSHTFTHAVLTGLDNTAVRRELVDSKKYLEGLLDEPVTAFCYPKGRFNNRLAGRVRQAGYRLARTTVAFQTDFEFDPICMPVSFQFVPHAYGIHIQHALKEGNGKGLINWCRHWSMEKDLLRLSALIVEHIMEFGGLLHIWGHSWEIEKLGLWEQLEATFELLAQCTGVRACTNSEVLTPKTALTVPSPSGYEGPCNN